MNNEELEEQVTAQLTEPFLRRVVGSVHRAHQVARDDCRMKFAETEVQNVVPWYRRALLEGFLRDAADLTPQLSSRVVMTEGGWNHTEIQGGHIVLTASSVPYACGPAQVADYRLHLAQTNQPSLFDEPQNFKEIPLYAMLLHSRSSWDTVEEWIKWGHLPGSAYLVIPSLSVDRYIIKVDLFRKYPDIVAAHKPDDLDGIALVRYISRSRASYYIK